MPPSVAVSFVEEATRDGLSEGEMILLSKFEHALHCFLAFRLASCGWRCLDGRFLGEGKEIRFQGHAPGSVSLFPRRGSGRPDSANRNWPDETRGSSATHARIWREVSSHPRKAHHA